MIRGEPLTAIIPARGGSKGIAGKNLLKLHGETLLERTIKLAEACPFIDRTLVSTDHSEMQEMAENHGVATRELRPAELATDTAKTVDVINHVIRTEPIQRGYILLLQVTSPLRTAEDLEALCKAFEADDTRAQSIVSVVRFDSPHPDKIQKIVGGRLVSYLGKESMVARQSLPEVYALNGAFYLTHRDILLEKSTFMPGATMPFVMPQERSLNLDTPMDVLLLEAMASKGLA